MVSHDVLLLILNECLTQKQKHIISHLQKNELESSTQLVLTMAKELNCSKSCVWNNLNSLKRAGLIETNGIVKLSIRLKEWIK